MIIVHDPNLGTMSSKSTVAGGTTPFMSPELLVPSRFGQEKSTPTKEADIYAMAMTIYQVRVQQCPVRTQLVPSLQVLSGALPFGKLSGAVSG